MKADNTLFNFGSTGAGGTVQMSLDGQGKGWGGVAVGGSGKSKLTDVASL